MFKTYSTVLPEDWEESNLSMWKLSQATTATRLRADWRHRYSTSSAAPHEDKAAVLEVLLFAAHGATTWRTLLAEAQQYESRLYLMVLDDSAPRRVELEASVKREGESGDVSTRGRDTPDSARSPSPHFTYFV